MEVVWRFLVALIRPYSLSAIPGIFFGYFVIWYYEFQKKETDLMRFRYVFQPPKFVKQPFPGSRQCVTERIGHLGPGSDDVLFNSWMRGNELSELVWLCGLNVRPSPVNFRWLYTLNCCKLPVSARLTQVPNCPPVYCVGIRRLLSACGAQIR